MRHANDTTARHGGNRWVQLGKTLGGALLMHMATVRRDRTSPQVGPEASSGVESTAPSRLSRASAVPVLAAVAAVALGVIVIKRIGARRQRA